MESNGIGSYFQGLDTVNDSVRNYIEASLRLWNASALLEIAVKLGKCAQPQSQSASDDLEELLCQKSNLQAQYDLKPEPALAAKLDDLSAQIGRLNAETGRRGDTVILSRRELDTECRLFNQWGALAFVVRAGGSKVEPRLNLIVAHEFAHHLEELLAPQVNERIQNMFAARLAACDHATEIGAPELLSRDSQTNFDAGKRHFISAQARTRLDEYWAESAAAFSDKEARESLSLVDADMHALLTELVLTPETVVADRYSEIARAVRQERGITAETVQQSLA